MTIKINENNKSEFYVGLYFEALKKIDRINDIKVSFLKLALVSTFLYFAWLLANKTPLQDLSTFAKLCLWFTPLMFNTIGLSYNFYLQKIAKRYGDFTRYIVKNIDGLRNLYEEFKKEDCSPRINSSHYFWLTLCAISLIAGIIGFCK